MYLFYIDESGNTGSNLDSPDQPVHWLVALGVSPGTVKLIEDEMLALALRYFPERARQPDFEFHGNHIYTRRNDCRGWPGERAVALYGALLDVVARHDCHLFVVGIDKARLKRRAHARYTPDHPYKLAFMYLVERIDEWLGQRSTPRGRPPVHGLIVADEQKEVDRLVIERFAFWRQLGTEYGWRGREIRFLIDTVHYVPSHDSWLIQMADCLAYLYSRYHRIRREKGGGAALHTPAEAAVLRLWEGKCAARLASCYLWPS